MVTEKGETEPKRAPSFAKNMADYFREYCSSTSIHGFRYFGEKRTIFEKIWWITGFSLCLTGLAISLLAVYQKWNKSPVIVTFATKPVPIFHLPFAAVTICSESKLNASAFNLNGLLAKNLNGEDLTLKERKILTYVAAICDDLDKSQFGNLTGESFFDIIKNIAPNYYPINCRSGCEKFFSPILTDEGLCYSFNILGREEMFNENVMFYSDFQNVSYSTKNWSMEYGYSPGAGMMTHPIRAILVGERASFKFDLASVKNDILAGCKASAAGYKALLHIPMRVPRLSQQYFRIPLDQMVSVAITPSMINTSETVKDYPPEKRECYFPSEKPLKFYRNYSKINCGFECLTNLTLSVCGCVHFSMPHENGTEICGGKDLRCMQIAETIIHVGYLAKHIQSNEYKSIRHMLIEADCGCLPLCTDVNYNIRISQTEWDWTRNKDNNFRNLSKDAYHLSRVSIYFESGDFIPSERNELYGPLEFLANFGGLLGLFTGFSVLSFLEIIYFLTVRLLCNVRLYGHWWPI